MEYKIRRHTGGGFEPINISEEEYRNLFIAKTGLSAMLGIEERFNMVLENFVEYEETLLNRSLQRMVFSNPPGQEFKRTSTLSIVG